MALGNGDDRGTYGIPQTLMDQWYEKPPPVKPPATTKYPGQGPGQDPGTDPALYQYPNYDSRQADISGYLDDVNNRQAPQITAQPTMPLATSSYTPVGQAAQIAPTQLAATPTLGPYSQASGGSASGGSAQAQQAANVTLDPAVLAQDSAVRGNLMEALNYQGGLMRGENSVAALQMARDRDYAMAQQMAAARSARPGNAVGAQAQAALNQGLLSGDFASRLAEAQLAERNAAATQYGQLGGTIRGQDLGLSEFNAGAQNTRNLAQGQISKDIGIANAGYGTQASIASANNATQASIASANNATAASIANAKNSLDAAMKRGDWESAAAINKMIQDAEGNRQQANMQTNVSINDANNNLQNSQYNAGATNQYNENNRSYQTGVDLSNANLQMQSRTEADQTRNALLNLRNDIDKGQLQGNMTLGDVLARYGITRLEGSIREKLTQMGIDARKAMQPTTWERVIGAATGLLGAAAPLIGAAIAGPAGAAAGAGIGVGLNQVSNSFSQAPASGGWSTTSGPIPGTGGQLPYDPGPTQPFNWP